MAETGTSKTATMLGRGEHDAEPAVLPLSAVAERASRRRGLVLFLRSIGWSHDLFQRPHQLARAFARHGWVAVFEDADSDQDDVEEVEPDLFVTRAPFEALSRLPATLLWTFTYNYDDRDRFPASIPCVYDWIDDLSVFHHDPSLLERNHHRALEEATLVTVVARRLLDQALALRSDAVYLPNGVDVEHFAPAGRRPDDPIVERLRAAGRPVAGYFGALADWFDFSLVHDVAVLRPDWSFLLIGPQYAGSAAVRDQPALALPNVDWIGPRPYRQLPAWLELFDVATIPFRINEITRSTSPLKLYEYFAGGRPVVTTPMPECAAHPEVRVVSDPEGFAAALDDCLALAGSAAFRRRLQAVALENSWSFRIAEVVKALGQAERRPREDRGGAPATGPAHPELVRELTTQRTRAAALEADLRLARAEIDASASQRGRLRAELEVVREAADLAVAAADARLADVRRRELEATARGDDLARRCAALETTIGGLEAEVGELRDGQALLERKLVQELEQAASTLAGVRSELGAARADAAAWREEAQRGPIDRFMRRAFRPRPEGRLTYWRRSLYYALARRILAAWRRDGQPGHGLASWYEYRFLRDRKRRREVAGTGSLSGLRCPGEPGLVSVVLPVFNGEALVEEAIDSVLAQTWGRFELIVVDDGSTDRTPEILDAYAARDPRVRVIHQPNQKLPQALSNGFRAARGELLTWTSDDNRMKPEFLERMVGCLERHPDWDMAYANVDIIGDDGAFLHGSDWYYGYQVPPGSPHVHLPADTAELNVWPNNYVGAAFMYRARVAWLLGDYCPDRFTVEDYDYWMQVNELLTLHHTDFAEPVYDYRFHDASLTSRDKELRILELRERLMVFDDFRRNFALSPLSWTVEPAERSDAAATVVARLRALAAECGNLVTGSDPLAPEALPRLWLPSVSVRVADRADAEPPDRRSLPPNTVTVLLVTDGNAPLPPDPGDWDLCAVLGRSGPLPRATGPWRGWLGFDTLETACTAVDIATRTRHLKAIEAEIASPPAARFEATVVVCTYRRSDRLAATLDSIGRQTLARDRFEVVVVNNDPREDLADLVEKLRQTAFADRPDQVRLVICPLKGLSHARNAGIAEARGEVVCFIDDDAVADESWLEQTLAGYRSGPRVGVVGGRILLRPPSPAPEWLERAGWSYWSHFDPGWTEPTAVEDWWDFPWGANWSARREVLVAMGGFRYGYGRTGNDFGGGEEIVAASLARRLGAEVVVAPGSIVHHHVDPARFTRQDLRRTIRAGTFVNYFTQRDLYVPMWLGPGHLLEQIGKRVLRLLAPWRMSRFQRFEARCFLRAELRLLATMLRDWRARAQRRA